MLTQPKAIISPFSGQTVRPIIKQVRVGDEIHTEAHYTCPQTNRYITKLVIEIKKIND
jgi:hypothetical protein